MKMTRTTVRRGLFGVFATTALSAAATAIISAPTAGAQPPPPPPGPCTAAALAHSVSVVANGAGGYLDTHPGSNNAITSAGAQQPEEAEATLRNYFIANPGELNDLRNIARPLTDLRNQCNQSISGGQIAALLRVFGP